MEKVLIDLFVVPEAAHAEFMQQAERSQQFIRTLPGFLEGYIYTQIAGEKRYNVLTTAVWATDEAFENSKTAVSRQHHAWDYNPQEALARLGVEKVRAIYHRSPY